MDQAQNRALTALQPFLHLAVATKSPSPRLLADLITRATSAQGTYIFAELLQTPAIQSLRSTDTPPEFHGYYKALEVFSYGTLADYQSTANLPTLTPPQQHKLTLLTLLSLASSSHPLSYPHLLTVLSLPSASRLESLITEAIYNGLITARLSPTSTPPTVHITSVAPLRDLRPNSLPEILKVLQVWESRCSGVVGEIEAQIQGIRNSAAKRKAREAKRQEIVDHAVLNTDGFGDANAGGGLVAAAGGAGGGGGGGATLGSGRATRSSALRGATVDESRKGKGIGSKRDLEEQQEDDDAAWALQGGGEVDGSADGGLTRMDVDEGAGKGLDSGRTAKRAAAKKGF